MRKGVIICIGKLRTSFWKEASDHYLKLTNNWRKIEIVELRDSSAAPPERPLQESRAILAALHPGDCAIALTEEGQQMTSAQFAAMLRHCDEKIIARPAFLIGGPYGHHSSLLKHCQFRLGLSSMTWPHELARVLLLEQLYRAESILRKTPYHH